MPDIFRTFRFFGNFTFGFLRPDITAPTITAARMVEVFHADRDSDGVRHCFVRISPLSPDDPLPSRPTSFPDAGNNIFFDDIRARIAAELESDGNSTFWISDPNKPGAQNGVRLCLFGAIICDQFADLGSDPSERFPLVANYKMKTWQRASTVIFGHSDTMNLRLELALPMPVGTVQAADVPLLSFVGIYPTTLAAPTGDTEDFGFVRPLVSMLEHRDTYEVLKGGGGANLSDRLGTYGLIYNGNAYELPKRDYLPDVGSLIRASGLERIAERMGYGGRIGIHADSTSYSVGVSRRVRFIEDDLLPLDAQLGAGFHTNPGGLSDKWPDVQAVWTIRISDAAVREALHENKTLPGLNRMQLRFQDKTQLKTIDQDNRIYQYIRQRKDAPRMMHGGGLHHVASLGAAARIALQTTDRQPQSILPDLYGGKKSETVAMVGYGKREERPATLSHPNAPIPSVSALPELTLTLDTTPVDGSEADPVPQSSPELQVELFLGYNRTDPLKINLRLPGLADDPVDHPVVFGRDPRAFDSAEAQADVTFLIANALNAPEMQFDARLGALAVERQGTLLAPRDPKNEHSSLELRRRARRDADPAYPDRADLDITWRLGLAIDSALPVTTDIPHGDRATRPDDLLIREGRNETAKRFGNTPPLRLEVTERLRDDQDRHLTAKIYDSSGSEDDSEKIVILNQRPWQAMRFTRVPLTSSGGAEGNAVAEYDSDRREWRQLKAADTYRYTLPAAVVGEAADKPGEWELIDPDSPATAPLHPAAPDHNGAPQRHAVDMRLSPPSTVWVEPSDLERNYFLAQYNIRSLFRQQGDFGIGVALHALRSEFIYGIATGLKVPDATATRAKPRLAATSALTGQMLSADQRGSGSGLDDRWPDLRAAFLDHAERLEVVDIDTSRPNPYVPARFDTGLTHALRRTALMRPPAGLDPIDVATSAQDGPEKPPRFADHGLAGGALWPIESANVARVVARNPVGTGVELCDVAFSPMGVSGNQTVRFVNGLVTVISETSEGRLHRHRVEVLGRIGVLWHRAKHVVVYERTTAPSAQFAPEDDQKRSHRPVLRKVEEFIELLESVRLYPDMPQAEMRSRGFLEEVRFNSHIIHVNSAWGRDLGTFGWEVPLWNRHAAALRPQVYPYPDIAFVSTAEGDRANPQVAQECQDAQNLFFYTDPVSAQKLGPDTDLWPARRGVDFGPIADTALLETMLDKLEPKREGAHRRTAASRLIPGMRRYTWRVAPAPVRARINATRGDKPVYAGVESVSLSRSPDTIKKPEDLTTDIPATLEALADNPLQTIPSGLDFPARRDALPDQVPQFAAISKTYSNYLASPSDATGKALIKDAKDLANSPDVAAIEARLGGGMAKARTLFANAKTKPLIQSVIEADEETCKNLSKSASDSLLRRRLLLARMIREAVKDTLAEIDSADPAVLRAQLQSQIDAVTKEVYDGLAEGAIHARGSLADARAIVTDWRAQSHLALNRARARVTALRGTFDNSKPWSQNRLEKALEQIGQAFDGAQHEATAALAEARQRFATELDTQSRAVGARIATAMQQTLKAEQGALKGLGTLKGAVNEGAERVVAQLQMLPDAAKANEALARLRAKAEELQPGGSGTAHDAVAAAQTAAKTIEAAKNAALTITEVAEKQAVASVSDVNEATTQVSGAAKRLLSDANAGLDALKKAVADVGDAAFDAIAEPMITNLGEEVVHRLNQLASEIITNWSSEIDAIEAAVDRAEAWADMQIAALDRIAARGHTVAVGWFDGLEETLKGVEESLPVKVREALQAQILDPLLNAAFTHTTWPDDLAAFRATARTTLMDFADELELALKNATGIVVESIDGAEELCKQLVGYKSQLIESVDEAKKAIKAKLEKSLKELEEAIGAGISTEIIKKANLFLEQTAEITNEMAEAADHAHAYVNRGLDIIKEIGDTKPSEAPGLALKLISAATASPEIAALKTNADRIRVLMKEAENTLKTPELKGLFDQLGDALKALGLDFEFKTFGDRFDFEMPSNGTALLRDLLPDFGGIDLSNMLPDATLPSGVRDAVKVTHDLDAKAGRAWVQADVNLKMLKRERMFSIGPFTLYLRNSTLKAQIRAEASKDSKEVATNDSAVMTTTIEAVVSGQVMVTLEDVVIRYSSKTKLDFDIDPKKIKIHKSLKFVQDTVGKIFGDDAGALKFIKQNGIPIGVEHQFAMPPLSLMYGTSGVSNIQIANRFSLVAYPDFKISNRFNLSRAELPFLFSFFIIGGTGYLQVDVDYQPFDGELMVVAEAGAGGSAALGFAFGPVNGSVFIALSVVLRYQKRIGGPADPTDGLSVSLLLVIAGNVSLFGIVTVYLGLRLSISYHESGRVDGLGQLSIEVRISRFFKLRYATSITYKLRDGQSTTQVDSSTDVSGPAVDAVKKAKALANARKSL